MRIPMYQVDAFADRLFAGNPAAVCPLEAWLPDETMQAIGAENNLSETAFLVPEGEGYRLRWFTPKVEVDLCGHATLASASVVFTHLRSDWDRVVFHTLSGRLEVARDGDLLVLDFPARPPRLCDVPDELVTALVTEPDAVLLAHEYMAVYPDEQTVRSLVPDMPRLAAVTREFGVIVTAPGEDCDFVSRFFAPAVGISEDPVTGSAHCALTPYWAERLGKRKLHARQVSARGGELWCEDRGDRVAIAGRAVPYLEGTIEVAG
jgi:predicted PhzF superfamily epimerase YddE/YHI9